jgi:hypothetical protein
VIDAAFGAALAGVAARDAGVSFTGLRGVAAMGSVGLVAGVL